MNVRLRHLGFSFAALALAIGTVAACGGGEDDDGTTGFDGVYRTQSEGLIGAIAFVANEDYMLMGPDCYARECTEFGTFTFDDKRQVLTLTNAADGRSRQLPVSEIETERLNPSDKLSTLDLVERDAGLIADAGTKLVDGGDAGLVEGGAGLLDGGDGGAKIVRPQPKKIVGSAKVGKQKATKASSKGTSSKGSSSSSSSSGGSSSGGSKDDDESDDKKSDDKKDDDKKDDKPTTTPTATPTSTSTTPPTSPVTTVKVDAGDASVTVVLGGDPTCIQTVPTAKSSLPEILAYFLRCPNGIRGTSE